MITITGTKIRPLNNLLYLMTFYSLYHNFVITDQFVCKSFSIFLPNFTYKTIANLFHAAKFLLRALAFPPFPVLSGFVRVKLSGNNFEKIMLRIKYGEHSLILFIDLLSILRFISFYLPALSIKSFFLIILMARS